jgi:hypothetical protein
MARTEELTKDIVVAWLGNPEVGRNFGSQLSGTDATKTGEYLATVYTTLFRAIEEATRKANERGRAAGSGRSEGD